MLCCWPSRHHYHFYEVQIGDMLSIVKLSKSVEICKIWRKFWNLKKIVEFIKSASKCHVPNKQCLVIFSLQCLVDVCQWLSDEVNYWAVLKLRTLDIQTDRIIMRICVCVRVSYWDSCIISALYTWEQYSCLHTCLIIIATISPSPSQYHYVKGKSAQSLIIFFGNLQSWAFELFKKTVTKFHILSWIEKKFTNTKYRNWKCHIFTSSCLKIKILFLLQIRWLVWGNILMLISLGKRNEFSRFCIFLEATTADHHWQ